ncbi:MAG: arylesterase, partial [Gammaproteobacteria bacterium]|nr:arylesterase [Gammaproteobacteria bacterium]
LAFGDSLTRVKGVSESFSYPSVLAQISGLEVVNAGVSGELSAAGLRRLPQVLESSNPDLVLLLHGGNDILRNQSKVNLQSNLLSMISLIEKSGAELLMLCLPEKSLFSSCSSVYTDLAEDHGVVLEKGIIAKLIKQPSMKSDTVHFNKAGYRALAEKVHEELKKEGWL